MSWRQWPRGQWRGWLVEQHEMPEVPGFRVEDPRRSRPEGIAKCLIADEAASGPNILGGSELHELAEQEFWPRKRRCGRLPPDIATRKLAEEVATHIQIISSCIARGTTRSARQCQQMR
jgi:hypothetical protein